MTRENRAETTADTNGSHSNSIGFKELVDRLNSLNTKYEEALSSRDTDFNHHIVDLIIYLMGEEE